MNSSHIDMLVCLQMNEKLVLTSYAFGGALCFFRDVPTEMAGCFAREA